MPQYQVLVEPKVLHHGPTPKTELFVISYKNDLNCEVATEPGHFSAPTTEVEGRGSKDHYSDCAHSASKVTDTSDMSCVQLYENVFDTFMISHTGYSLIDWQRKVQARFYPNLAFKLCESEFDRAYDKS